MKVGEVISAIAEPVSQVYLFPRRITDHLVNKGYTELNRDYGYPVPREDLDPGILAVEGLICYIDTPLQFAFSLLDKIIGPPK